MIKKTILIFFPIIVLVGLFCYKMESNRKVTDIENVKKIPLKIKPNTIQCPQCHMYLSGNKFAVQIITKDLKTHFFDDVGCAILWMKGNKINPEDITIWAYTLDTKRWINAKKAHFSINDFETPMHYGFGTFEKNKKNLIDFKEMRLRMLKGENMKNPKIRRKILAEIKKDNK